MGVELNVRARTTQSFAVRIYIMTIIIYKQTVITGCKTGYQKVQMASFFETKMEYTTNVCSCQYYRTIILIVQEEDTNFH